jgi:hypothetical protein
MRTTFGWDIFVRCALILPLLCSPSLGSPAAAEGAPGKRTVQNVHEIGEVLAACMQPLSVTTPFPGMRVTVRLGFNGRGELLGPPRFTYVTPIAPSRVKAEYKNAISDALRRCTPLSFSPQLGATIAGVPVILRFGEGGVIQATVEEPPAYAASVPLPSLQMAESAIGSHFVITDARGSRPFGVSGVAAAEPATSRRDVTGQRNSLRCAEHNFIARLRFPQR